MIKGWDIGIAGGDGVPPMKVWWFCHIKTRYQTSAAQKVRNVLQS